MNLSFSESKTNNDPSNAFFYFSELANKSWMEGYESIYINPFSAEYKVQRILIMLSITYDRPPKTLNALTEAIKLEWLICLITNVKKTDYIHQVLN